MSLKRYTYRIKPLSKLALSPRDHQGFHLAAGDFKEDQIQKVDGRDIKIIYPFYQYGSYESYQPDKADYYIPGSSIKGALVLGDQKNSAKLMVDDVRIDAKSLELTSLYKLQYMSKDSSIPVELGLFFPNVAVEMLQVERSFTGELFCEADISTYFQTAHKNNMRKLEQLRCKLGKVVNSIVVHQNSKQKVLNLIEQIKKIETNRETQLGSYLLLLGGFKGLALSGLFDITNFDKLDTAVYLDQSTNLPYGLVQITDLKEMV
ncbi:hypothetical protein DET54_11458 [Paenibacillus pabuli]|uniref:Uncharacterized protein n=1 Tax=Paenibacillus pabuli TaxID=1472 RepID=A0ABX9BEX5_9BACL|nr:hypothetical protein [Paenibacillus pabuli]RAI89590.1 hypothetical protein DET54_11458 [Paenibacillus pabuli]